MDDLRNREYNGWENRWTWLVHLHLSNEQAIFLEMVNLVASQATDASAGRLVEQWVRESITTWMNRVPGRKRWLESDCIYLLVWDVLGAALASTEWDDLVTLLTGGERVSNGFTMTLFQHIQHLRPLHGHIAVVLCEASSLVAAADALKAWFEALLADWVDRVVIGQQVAASIELVFSALLENVYGLVAWEQVARAFRTGYSG